MELLEIAQELAIGAGKIVSERYNQKNSWKTKTGAGDIVTEVDIMSEKYIIDKLKELRPDDAIISEEAGSSGDKDAEFTWIMDPIDGTRNFAKRIPFFCVSLACVKNGQPYIGAIYDPLHDELFYAQKGKGAFMNGESIKVSDVSSLNDAMLSICWVKEKVDNAPFIESMQEFGKDTSYFRRYGSAALVMAYIACGKLDGYVQAGLCPWDVAAGITIIEEAGGIISDFKGKPIDLKDEMISIIAGNKYMYDKLYVQFKEN